MSISFLTILRNRTALPSCSNFLLRHVSSRTSRFGFVSIAARQNPNSNRKQPPHKNLLKAKDSVRELSSLSPLLSLENRPVLMPNQAIGMVAAAQANFMRVIVESAGPTLENASEPEEPAVGVELLCVVRALLKKIKRRVLVGDKVLVGSIDWVDRRGMIENVYQRSSEILDPPVANVDHLLVLFSMEQPKLEAFSLTRFLVEAESVGIPLTLALNKLDLVDEETQLAWKARLRKWGYEPLFCSVESKHGLDSLEFILRDQTTVTVGPSGVGKSSLINALRSNQRVPYAAEADNWFEHTEGSKWFEDQRVGTVSTRSGRGKHTTRHVSLLPLSGKGYLADTPGFNQPSLMKVTKKSLAQTFPEIRRRLNASELVKCSFSDCLHLGEPGCVVKGDWERYPYYLQLLDEIKIREEFQLRTLGTKREGDVRYKVGDMGIQQAEPRLEMKKHRRQSRKRMNQSILEELDELDDVDEDNMENVEDGTVLRATGHENK
ncbi:small ribosomal subunit biogenesis GTPase RsgA 1, mitochondrial isoform X2 [Macadamia integrifolia]|uniref:small ribosomal subunit biogenesis GTPase RsgA 1, mitochondrial isoform X2 n=1 Tax=Macadamia integrifolia TaxID=60698 RepID=UPI001C4EDA42|nr:small ribosomal subunit biogenesis GTPase RsgA 1, mitochondrial isoform X2 [Macadamia integrifolia]